MIETETLKALKALSVRSPLSPKKSKRSATTTTTKKAVTFATEENERQVRTFDVPDDVENDELWFTADEYDTMKSQSRAEAREWRKMGYVKLLNDTFESPRLDAQNYIVVFCTLDGTLNRRGLERHCSRKHGEERSDCKDQARHIVLATQERLKPQQTPVSSDHHQQQQLHHHQSSTSSSSGSGKRLMSADEISYSIAAAYSSYCRDAKIFARRIAKADEFVALEKVADPVDLDQQLAILSSCGIHKQQRRLSNYSASTASIASYGSSRIIPFPSSNNNNNNHSNGYPNHGLRRSPVKKRGSVSGSPMTLTEELYAAMA